jgi:hypothetical protein
LNTGGGIMARRLLMAIGWIVIVLTTAVVVTMTACEPPSLARLESRFPRQRTDLERLVAMSDHDAQLIRIAPSWLMTSGQQYMEYSAETGITQDRWDEYRHVFARNTIADGLQRDHDTGDIYFIVRAVGIVNRGHSSGYLHCGPGPSHRYPPCSVLDAFGEHTMASDSDVNYAFRRIGQRWYAYSEGPD